MPQMSPMAWMNLSIMMFLAVTTNTLNMAPKSDQNTDKAYKNILNSKKWTW